MVLILVVVVLVVVGVSCDRSSGSGYLREGVTEGGKGYRECPVACR